MRALALVALISLAPGEPAPKVQAFTLPNGLRVLLLEDHGTPLLRAKLCVTWDPLEEPAEKPGLGTFLGSLLEHAGPGFQSRSAFDRASAALGVRLQFHPAPGRLEWAASARSADQEAALQAIAHLVMRTSLEGPLMEGLRLNTQRSLEAMPAQEAIQQRFLAHLQGFAPLEEAALRQMAPVDVEELQRRVVRPERAVLGLVGDLNLAQAKALALLHLGSWGPGPVVAPARGMPLPALQSLAEGAPEAWLGACLPKPTAQTRGALELLTRMLQDLPDTPLRRGSGGSLYLLSKERVAQAEGLPTRVHSLRQSWNALPNRITPEALDLARKRWLEEEALLPLNPGRQLDRGLERSLGSAARAEEIRAVTVEEVRALLATALASPRLLLLGAPKASLALWLKETEALRPWAGVQSATSTPKREARSR